MERAGEFIDRPTAGQPAEPESLTGAPLAPSNLAQSAEAADADLELHEEVELPLESAVSGTTSTPPPKRKAASSTKAPPSRPPRSAPATSLVPLEPAQLRQLVVEQPELLEPGLSVHSDESGGEVGGHYRTEVGEIDLLARDEGGAFVVVMVAGAEPVDETIPEMLRRIGWVRKHLVKAKQSVRGILLLESMNEELQYAAAAVSDTIDFRSWRLSLSFEKIDP